MEIKILAHRGNGKTCPPDRYSRKRLPEHTLAAFRVALDSAVAGGIPAGVEFDIRKTKDGVPVVTHWESLEEINSDAFTQRRRIRDLTFKEISESCQDSRYQVPSLEQFLDSISEECALYNAKYTKPFLLQIEPKDIDALPEIFEVVNRCVDSGKFPVESFILSTKFPDIIQEAKKYCPKIRCSLAIKAPFLFGEEAGKPGNESLRKEYLESSLIQLRKVIKELQIFSLDIFAMDVRPSLIEVMQQSGITELTLCTYGLGDAATAKEIAVAHSVHAQGIEVTFVADDVGHAKNHFSQLQQGLQK